MKCRNCGAALERERFDRALGIITCGHCGGLHKLDGDAFSSATGERSADSQPKQDLSPDGPRAVAARPSSFDLKQERNRIEVSWPEGSRRSAAILGMFALLWIGLTVGTGAIVVAPVGLVLLYIAVVRALNRNRLSIEPDQVVFKRGPLPWLGAQTVARKQLRQVFAREVISRNASIQNGREHVRIRHRYHVAALMDDGGSMTLIPGLPVAEHALWLEQFIERSLGIEDHSVAGAFQG